MSRSDCSRCLGFGEVPAGDGSSRMVPCDLDCPWRLILFGDGTGKPIGLLTSRAPGMPTPDGLREDLEKLRRPEIDSRVRRARLRDMRRSMFGGAT